MSKKTPPPAPAPLLGPLTESEWFAQTCAAMLKPDATAAQKAEYGRLLKLRPDTSKTGDLAVRAQHAALEPYTALPMLAADVAHRLKLLRAELAGPNPSPLELLIIDVICSAYQDFWEFTTAYKRKTGKEFTLHAMEQFERIVNAKQARYERAIERLARVRRMLNLQININMPGGQQVNVQGR